MSDKGLILEANLTAATLLGVARNALVKERLDSFILPEDQDIYYLHRNLLFKTGEPQACELRLLSTSATPLWVRIDAALATEEETGKPVCRALMSDITQHKQAEQNLQDILESLRKAVRSTIQVIISTVEARDPYTAGHQRRSADLARAIATEMKLSQDRIEGIRIACSIHDLGKLSIPAEILSKPRKLTEDEFSLIKEHARKGYDILKNVESSWPLAEIVYQHHERMDGSGYPRNLKGDEILMEARILAVSDIVEAMASHRPYRAALGIDAVLKEIDDNRGILYDPEAVDACLNYSGKKVFNLKVLDD